MIHRDQRRPETRVVLDETETWLLRERLVQQHTAAAYTARVAGFADGFAVPIEASSPELTAATVIQWVNLEATLGLKASTLRTQTVMLRPFLRSCHRTGRTPHNFAGAVAHAASWRLSTIPDRVGA